MFPILLYGPWRYTISSGYCPFSSSPAFSCHLWATPHRPIDVISVHLSELALLPARRSTIWWVWPWSTKDRGRTGRQDLLIPAWLHLCKQGVFFPCVDTAIYTQKGDMCFLHTKNQVCCPVGFLGKIISQQQTQDKVEMAAIAMRK